MDASLLNVKKKINELINNTWIECHLPGVTKQEGFLACKTVVFTFIWSVPAFLLVNKVQQQGLRLPYATLQPKIKVYCANNKQMFEVFKAIKDTHFKTNRGSHLRKVIIKDGKRSYFY